jgi:glycosyltransferase involved in cell wall biosynthesis
MKIVINAFSARLGGGQTYLRNILEHIPDIPNLVVLVFAPETLQLPDLPQLKRVYTRWPTTNPLSRALWERIALPSFLHREHADVLFCPGGVVATSVPKNCKVVSMFQNMIPFDASLVAGMPWGLQRLRNLILRRVLLRSFTRADTTIFISDYARNVIEQIARIPNPVTIPHGISDGFRVGDQALPRPRGAPDSEYLLYVSRFDVYKHHREVVSAFSMLPDEVKAKYKLVFIGETNLPEAQPVARLVETLGLSNDVLILGAVPHSDLPAWYQHAAAILFASSCENCPIILLEAMASGRPVLSSDVMPMPEFGGSGIAYFSPFDARDIYKAMIKTLSDESYARSVAQAALAKSRQFTWELAANVTWHCLVSLAREGKRV